MIESIIEAKELIREYFAEEKDLREAIENGDIDDVISELADSDVNIYTKDLLDWLASDLNNIYLVEEAIKEFGWTGDLIKAIQLGQYKRNEEFLFDALEIIKEELEEAN